MKYGKMTMERYRAEGYGGLLMRRLRVFVNGIELTRDCCEFDDREGYAVVNKVNSDGRYYLDSDGTVARELVRGHVSVKAVKS